MGAPTEMIHGLLVAAAEVNPSGGSGSTIVLAVVALIGSGGLLGGTIAFFKLRPEKDSIVVTTAQGALLMQTGITEELRKENERLHAEIQALKECVEARDVTIRQLLGERGAT